MGSSTALSALPTKPTMLPHRPDSNQRPDNRRAPARPGQLADGRESPGLGCNDNPVPIRSVGARYAAGRSASSTQNFSFSQFCRKLHRMITTAQIRAARGLLKWTQATLAHRAAISAATLNMIENDAARPRDTTLQAIRRALETGGVQMLEENGTGVGVRFSLNPSPGGASAGPAPGKADPPGGSSPRTARPPPAPPPVAPESSAR